MKTKPITFLLALTFLFLFSGSSVVFADALQDGRDAYERKDYETSYKLIAPLAEQGNAYAQFNLGAMYDKGRGVPQDFKEAVKWYRLSAGQGFGLAQFNFGLMYAQGKGVSKDYVLAHMWWSLASSNGEKDAIDNRKQVEKEMSPQQIEKAQQLARNWKPSDRIKIAKSSPFVSRSDLQDATDAYERNDYKEAYKILLPLAKRGVAKGQYNLGLMYFKGKGVPQDYKEAVRWFRLSAEQEFGLAQYNLGFMYEKGHGVPQDYKEAVRLYRLAAEQGDAKAQYNLGLMYAEGKGVLQDYVLAHKWWSLASSNGDKDAIDNRKQVETKMSPSQIEKAQQLARNWKLRDRIKIEKSPPSVVADYLQDAVDAYKRNDYKEAIRLFRLSAEKGNAGGQYGLGGMYEKGHGVPQDYKEAVKWYRLSAEQGFDSAQYNLGWMYAKGQGVSQDDVLAHMWWSLASSNGHERASKHGKLVEKGMSPQQIEKAKELARNWKPSDRIKIAKSPPSVFADDLKDATDAYKRNDYKEAFRLFQLLAEKGNATAQSELGFMHYRGQGVLQDYKEANKWIRLSAEQGNAEAQHNLGFMYGRGEGVPQDYKEANKWIRLSAEQGYANAQSDLGFMYKQGQGVSQDYVLALMWWIIASYDGNQTAVHERKILVKEMSPSQIEKAKELARNWKPNNKIKTEESPPSTPQPPKSNGSIATGTGFLFGSQDYIITNYHVVKGTSPVKVKFLNGESINAEVIAKDTQNDIAVLKLTKSPSFQSREMKFGDSSRVRMGDKVFTIGYPSIDIMGYKPKYTEGVISAVTGIKDNPTVFQTTVPIQPGNSGGPLFNDKGEVVGLTTSSLSLLATESMGAVPQNVNYAVKSSFVKNIIGTVPEALLSNRGIVVVPTDSNSRADFIEAISKNVVLILGKVD